MAGGRSSRFGRDKLSVAYGGVPLLHHSILRLAEVCDDVVVVTAPEAAPPVLPVGVPARLAHDAAEGEGPLAGLVAGLAEVRTEWALVAGGDMPDLSRKVLLEMLHVAAEAPADAVALQQGGRSLPLPIALRAGPAREAGHSLLHAGEHRLGAILEALRTAAIDETTWTTLDPEQATLRDIDEPGDLIP